MIRRTLKYSLVALVLAIALLLQPLCSALTLIAQAPVAPGQADRPAAHMATPCYPLYLPRLSQATTSLASTGSIPKSSEVDQVPAAVHLFQPDFVITTPGEGWSISRMSYFAVQPIDLASVASVS